MSDVDVRDCGVSGIPAPQAFPAIASQRPKAHILIVDDEELIRESLGTVFEEDGYRVSFAENGRDALTWLYSQDPPDIIVLDLRMPVMDGWEFRAIQTREPGLCGVPVLAISADGSAEAAAISAQAYLRRPVEATTLLATVERVLRDSAPMKAAQAGARSAAFRGTAAAVANEIDEPLAALLKDLRQAVADLSAPIWALQAERPLSGGELEGMRASLLNAAALLGACQVGGDRIRLTLDNLKKLVPQSEGPAGLPKV